MERKLASIRRIDKLEPIEGADKILKATVGGWQLVTAKDNGFKEGDLVVYLEIDSWVPTEIAPFLSKGKEPREFNGVKGERLKTIKLRGTLSQGLIIPLDVVKGALVEATGNPLPGFIAEGDDVTEILGIQKWEKPLPAQLAGQTRRYFPPFLRKTDQERVQNLKKEVIKWTEEDILWEVTEKLEGSSMTVYAVQSVEDTGIDMKVIIDVGVCSRNLDLKMDQEGNAFVDTAKKTGLVDALTRYVGLGYGQIAVQGELIGPGVQGNIYGLNELQFHVFDIWDITNQTYFMPEGRDDVVTTLQELGANIYHVPVLGFAKLDGDIFEIISLADGKSVLADVNREGLVFKSTTTEDSFKAISNVYLGSEKE